MRNGGAPMAESALDVRSDQYRPRSPQNSQ